MGRRFHASINRVTFPLYLASSVGAIAFVPSELRRNILLGGVIATLAQVPITRLWIAPIAVNIKDRAESENEEGNEEELLDTWNRLSVYRMGLNVLGLGSLIAALIV